MIYKVFEKFDIDLHKHCSGDFGDFKTYELNLGDFDSLKYANNIEWGCMRIILSKGMYSIMGYLPTINFNGIRNMLMSYANTGDLKYGQNVKTIKILDDKKITEKNFDRVVANVKHFLEKFDEHEVKIQQFLNKLNINDFKQTVEKLSTEIEEKQKVLDEYKDKFYKNIKAQLSAEKDF